MHTTRSSLFPGNQLQLDLFWCQRFDVYFSKFEFKFFKQLILLQINNLQTKTLSAHLQVTTKDPDNKISVFDLQPSQGSSKIVKPRSALWAWPDSPWCTRSCSSRPYHRYRWACATGLQSGSWGGGRVDARTGRQLVSSRGQGSIGHCCCWSGSGSWGSRADAAELWEGD